MLAYFISKHYGAQRVEQTVPVGFGWATNGLSLAADATWDVMTACLLFDR